jgi:hypothetical protein
MMMALLLEEEDQEQSLLNGFKKNKENEIIKRKD